MKSVGSKLIDISIAILGVSNPVITMSIDKLSEFNKIIKKYNWKKTGIINSEIEFNKEK